MAIARRVNRMMLAHVGHIVIVHAGYALMLRALVARDVLWLRTSSLLARSR
jgi:hypothetical protein